METPADRGELEWPMVAGEELYEGVHRVVAAVAALGGAVGWLSEPSRAEVDSWLDRLLVQVPGPGPGCSSYVERGGSRRWGTGPGWPVWSSSAAPRCAR